MKTKMKKVSIIIPNYNNERYILACLDSVLAQNYSNKEIIIVDDGSTDNSVKIINEFIKKNKKEEISLITQSNLNAAMARNEGIRNATGDYALFLDSDDVLEGEALKTLVDGLEKFGADIAIGNFVMMNEKGKIVDKVLFTEKTMRIEVADEFSKLCDFSPAPMNKLFKLDIIRNNKIVWGNVKIGQDLNFYLKYLLFCNKAALVDKTIYRYRLSTNSVSRSYDFRIFDIVNTFLDIERFYNQNGASEIYEKYLPFQILKHYDIQMTKQVFFGKHKVRNMIVGFFADNANKIDFSKYDKNNLEFSKLKRNFGTKCRFRLLYTSFLYRRYKLWRLEHASNI